MDVPRVQTLFAITILQDKKRQNDINDDKASILRPKFIEFEVNQ